MKMKKDKYRKSRGGTSQIYKLYCSKCGDYLLTYQKDGIGALLRLYVDRIITSNAGVSSNLICGSCTNLVGVPMVYKPEDREAYRLVRGSFSKEKV